MLLVAQSLLLAAISYWRLSAVPWSGGGLEQFRDLEPVAVTAVGTAALFLPIGLLALIAAAALLFRLRAGWFLAMIGQVLALSSALLLHFTIRPFFAFPVMLSGIVLVLYLNAFSVRAVFHTLPQPPLPETGHES